MKIEEFIGKMEDAADLCALPLEILHLTDHSVKARITILEDIWIQFYFHEISGKKLCFNWLVKQIICQRLHPWLMAYASF